MRFGRKDKEPEPYAGAKIEIGRRTATFRFDPESVPFVRGVFLGIKRREENVGEEPDQITKDLASVNLTSPGISVPIDRQAGQIDLLGVAGKFQHIAAMGAEWINFLNETPVMESAKPHKGSRSEGIDIARQTEIAAKLGQQFQQVHDQVKMESHGPQDS